MKSRREAIFDSDFVHFSQHLLSFHPSNRFQSQSVSLLFILVFLGFNRRGDFTFVGHLFSFDRKNGLNCSSCLNCASLKSTLITFFGLPKDCGLNGLKQLICVTQTVRLETKSCRILSLTYVTKYDLT